MLTTHLVEGRHRVEKSRAKEERWQVGWQLALGVRTRSTQNNGTERLYCTTPSTLVQYPEVDARRRKEKEGKVNESAWKKVTRLQNHDSNLLQATTREARKQGVFLRNHFIPSSPPGTTHDSRPIPTHHARYLCTTPSEPCLHFPRCQGRKGYLTPVPMLV